MYGTKVAKNILTLPQQFLLQILDIAMKNLRVKLKSSVISIKS